MARIPIAGPWITRREVELAAEAAATGWYARANAYQTRFEQAFADHVGVRHAVSLPSCTAAIHLALLALGVGPGDEVIVPEITWIASAAPISYVGARPVFADVDRATWCLSPDAVERCLSPRTRAVIAVDLYGGMADWERLRAIAERAGVALVEDAAQAVGAEIGGRRAGSFGDIGVFSFHGSKTLTTGEGGMLVTDRDDLVDRVRFLRDHGRAPGPRTFWNTEVAHKYKMSAVQAAIGIAQLERLDELVTRKRALFGWYREHGADLPGVSWNVEPPGTKNAYWMVTAVLDPEHGLEKERLMALLAEHEIETRPMFYPLSSLPAYAGTEQASRAAAENRVAYAISPLGVNLPSALLLEEAHVRAVCEALRRVLAEHGRRTPAGA